MSTPTADPGAGTGPDRDATEDACTTTRSFAPHGVADGSDLIGRTYYRLRDAYDAPEDTAAFYAALGDAFLVAFAAASGEPRVPAPVRAAVDDAEHATRAAVADVADPDLRTDVVTTFYRQVAGFHCAYHGAPERPALPGE